MYIKDSLVSEFDSGDYVQIAFSGIQKVEVYKKAKGRTLSSWLIPGLGVPILAVGIVAIIIAVDMSSGLGGGMGSFP